jgi:hypothetical protein
MADSKVDWNFWVTLRQVKVWQAVALSLDLDPDTMNQSRDFWRHPPEDRDIPNVRLREEFGLRMRLLVDERLDRERFSEGSDSSDTPANHRVQLAEVASWLVGLDRVPVSTAFLSALDMPDGRVTIAASPEPSPPAPPPPPAPLTIEAWQEDQISRTTRALGMDPLALPASDPKNPVAKSLIRARCGKNHPVKMRAAIFNKAWDRMLTRTPPGLKYDA